ncbi:hypothetical protein J2Z60_001302 [Lactobacillus colini]|uniref:Uncharacterized protein n=1 Tax=Lactobacillus colini TaxID=1819254 RepID=A0ABS4MEL2_9LACO|nr:LVIS_2131 family protein [Lactobacillus colini]MBP2058125.1 hypothetical protein [Lactobacillus colini]
MTIGWNALGIIVWLSIVLYLVFIIQNIRSRHLVMIVRDRKRFEWKTTLIDILEVAILVLATGFMLFLTFFNNPKLDDPKAISSEIDYQPLILTAGNKRSYYVKAESNNTSSVQTYKFYSNGNSYTVSSNNATVSDGKDPMTVSASAIPFSKKELLKADSHYQRAYVATYTATYKKNWFNGLGLHSGRQATKYYLIRIPDRTFVKETKR